MNLIALNYKTAETKLSVPRYQIRSSCQNRIGNTICAVDMNIHI